MIYFIGFVLVIYSCFYGSYANPLWKLHENHTRYANALVRAIIGLPAWVAVVFLMLGNVGNFFLWLAITAVLSIPSILKMRADGILCFRSIHLLIMASMGAYARVLLAWTIIGLFVTRKTKRAAEIGWANTAMEWMESNAQNASRDNGPSISEILDADIARKEREAAEEAARRQPVVEVWREQNDGSMKRLQVNSDGSMYKDPDTGEWRKIQK